MSDVPVGAVDAALADLALSAVQRLAIEMGTAKNARDRISAANSILDRLGYGRATRTQQEVADAEIRNALQKVVGSAPQGVPKALEK